MLLKIVYFTNSYKAGESKISSLTRLSSPFSFSRPQKLTLWGVGVKEKGQGRILFSSIQDNHLTGWRVMEMAGTAAHTL